MKFKGVIPNELIESIKNGKCVLFVGSGISSSVTRSNKKNLPTWQDFLIELLDFAISKNVIFWNGPDEIREIINKKNYLLAAEELQECLPLGEFAEFLNLVFRDKSVKPTQVHKKISEIPFRCVLTSNYDTLIEGSYTMGNGGQIPLKFIQEDLSSISSPLRKEDFFIFKIHGDIERPESIVLGSKAYNNLLFRRPEYLSFLQTLFTTHTVLFVGFGGSDVDLDFVVDRLSTIYSRTLHKHFILLPDQYYNLTEKRRLLKDKRIEVIDYTLDKSHSQVSAFFDNISSILKPKKVKPEIDDEIIEDEIFPSHRNMMMITSRKFGEQTKDSHGEVMGKLNVTSWYWGITDENEVPEQLIFDKTNEGIIIILDKDFMKSKILESLFELLLIRESENSLKLFVFVIGTIELPPIISSRILYTRINEKDADQYGEIIYLTLKKRKIL